MLQGKYNPWQKKDLEQLVTEALTVSQLVKLCRRHSTLPLQCGKNVLKHKDQKKELETHIRASKLKNLDLENAHTMG